MELPYLFALGGVDLPLAPDQARLAAQMVGYWSAFAHNGNPNGGSRPHWPAVRERVTGPSLAPAGQGDIHLVDVAAEHHCGFWAGLREGERVVTRWSRSR